MKQPRFLQHGVDVDELLGSVRSDLAYTDFPGSPGASAEMENTLKGQEEKRESRSIVDENREQSGRVFSAPLPSDGVSLLDYDYLIRHQKRSKMAAPEGPAEGKPSDGAKTWRPVAPDEWPFEIEEGARRIASALLAEQHKSGQKLFLFVGPRGGEGTTTLTQATAETLARAGHRVLLVDSDVRKLNSGKRYGVESGIGLVDVQFGRTEWRKAVRPTPVHNLFYLAPGILRLGEEASSWRLDRLLSEWEKFFRFVLADCPPLLCHPMASFWASASSQAVVVVRAHHTRRQVLSLTVDELSKLGMSVVAVVLNERDFPIPDWLYKML